MRFTGHERDANGTGTADDLDYMHARYCSPNQGRFLSVDKVLGKPPNPQSWNRYLYAQGNPVKFVDPDGNEALAAIRLEQDIQAVLAGDMSREEFRERNQARASGAALGVTLLLPGPEDLALGYAATTRLGKALLGRACGVLKRVFSGKRRSRVSQDTLAKLSTSDRRTVRSLQKQIEAHETKLAEFRRDPDAFDNRGHLANATTAERRAQIIESRIRVLEKQIDTFEKTIEEILQGVAP